MNLRASVKEDGEQNAAVGKTQLEVSYWNN